MEFKAPKQTPLYRYVKLLPILQIILSSIKIIFHIKYMQNRNILGKKFGRLLVIKQANSIFGGNKIKRYWGAWRCHCDCGIEKIVKTVHLNKGQVTSCGCLKKQFGTSLIPGQKINKLTTISFNNGKWLCSCECGKTTVLKTNSITSGKTKSCGCGKFIFTKEKIEKLHAGRRKFTPTIASARKVWKSYVYIDKKKYNNNCLSFEQFLEKSQQPCWYCGIIHNNCYNNFEHKSNRGSINSKKFGKFHYNGLDRIDSNDSHHYSNVITCCYYCNRAKSNMSQNDFINKIKNLKINKSIPLILKLSLPDNGSLATSIRCIYKNYNNGDLTIEEFYYLSQQPCHYCGVEKQNTFNRARTDKKASELAKTLGGFHYNGIDRIDSTLGHIKNNTVPCCRYCNWAKGKSTLEKFQGWIIRIKNYQILTNSK